MNKIASYARGQLKQLDIDVQRSDGGFYFFPIFRRYKAKFRRINIETSEDFCERFLLESGVALLPGSVFGRPRDELSVRLAYVDFDGRILLEILEKKSFADLETELISKYCPNIEQGLLRLRTYLDDL